ncbi:MAG: hypothetical protein KBD24_01320 [Candidatus Pacebacteria bacterium]|nr:hypothetical protein [Candidatus Paceibacterota bacterium]
MAFKKVTTSPIMRAFESWKGLSVPKQFLVVALVLVGLAVVFSVLRVSLYGTMRGMQANEYASYDNSYSVRGMMQAPMMVAESDSVNTKSSGAVRYDGATPSIAPSPAYTQSGGTGAYEESAYETREYSATIKTGDMDAVCTTVEGWKPLPDVVFEQATRGERYCSYRFKVPHAKANAMLVALRALHPTDLTADTESVKRQMAQYDGELDILLRKQALLTKTLEDSVTAYDELVVLSKSAEDVEVLSKVIDSKLAQIERLTQQRIALAGQLQRLTRTMGELEDRVAFAYFNVSVQKYEIIDGDAIIDSWVSAMRTFTAGVNDMFQSMTLGLLLNLLVLAQVVVYLLILLIAVKLGWKAVVNFWKS